jgi:hypothetical protein
MLIKGDNDYLYLLGHLASCLISCGRIYPGQDVAMSGQTGYSTGYHLHLEILKKISDPKITWENMFSINRDNQFIGWINENQKNNRFNPFDHNDKFNTFE